MKTLKPPNLFDLSFLLLLLIVLITFLPISQMNMDILTDRVILIIYVIDLGTICVWFCWSILWISSVIIDWLINKL